MHGIIVGQAFSLHGCIMWMREREESKKVTLGIQSWPKVWQYSGQIHGEGIMVHNFPCSPQGGEISQLNPPVVIQAELC